VVESRKAPNAVDFPAGARKRPVEDVETEPTTKIAAPSQ
jgi:hypothetical protein